MGDQGDLPSTPGDFGAPGWTSSCPAQGAQEFGCPIGHQPPHPRGWTRGRHSHRGPGEPGGGPSLPSQGGGRPRAGVLRGGGRGRRAVGTRASSRTLSSSRSPPSRAPTACATAVPSSFLWVLRAPVPCHRHPAGRTTTCGHPCHPTPWPPHATATPRVTLCRTTACGHPRHPTPWPPPRVTMCHPTTCGYLHVTPCHGHPHHPAPPHHLQTSPCHLMLWPPPPPTHVIPCHPTNCGHLHVTPCHGHPHMPPSAIPPLARITLCHHHPNSHPISPVTPY